MKTIFITIILLFNTSLIAESSLETVIKLDAQIKVLKVEMNLKIYILKKELDITGQELFQNEQKAWEKYLKTKTIFTADRYRGGTLSKIIALKAMLETIKIRLRQIENYIEIYNTT